jgi:FimV-like protein
MLIDCDTCTARGTGCADCVVTDTWVSMGDKDGARELLNEVMKDGDAAQKGTAQQLLAKLG